MKTKKIECVTVPGLRRLIMKTSAGNPSAWSKDHDITPQQTSAFLRGTQTAGEKVPAALGLVPITVYVPRDSDLAPARKEPEKKSKKASKKAKKAKKR